MIKQGKTRGSGWPKGFSRWAANRLNELEAIDTELGSVFPENAPEWVHKMGGEVGKMMHPAVRMPKTGESGVSFLGALVGHQKWLLEDENGLCAQFKRVAEAMEFLEDELKRKLSKKSYDRLAREGEKLAPKIEAMCDAAAGELEKRERLVGKCLQGIQKRSLDEQAEFFESYSKAIRKPPLDENGTVVSEPFPGVAKVYGLLLFNWGAVEKMSSINEVHRWLCRVLGDKLIGQPDDPTRTKGIAKRFGIKLAPRGRPKKK